MANVLVLCHSAYGHVETLAQAVAEGARRGGAQAAIRRVPGTVPRVCRAVRTHHAIDRTTPPSTRMAAPVVAEACSEAR
jgi:NAD(P)H dehydrogenase (quinone)